MNKLIIFLGVAVVVMLGFTPYLLSAKKEKEIEQCKLRAKLYSDVEVIYSDGCYADFGNGVYVSVSNFDPTLYTRKQVLEKSNDPFVIINDK
ncbi:hypothetical protein MOC16_gp192 [Klebsiella phage vB_KpM_FBKp24]|uniref:Uncharacterized protein n=1 Tax=Klebsiella phage vB_KpM_FBKp24 TaxID=2801834 RepID=A0A7U0GBR6_9CAUD|nr:hypothetical protein MOC16_gp192 [Klebsiella phage vB_KpM_FBKp24]QQV92314.1 hypothetical protein vBKpMFBKp24_221 [Klebsiella phage vB_KpM_FBKp24]